MKYDMLESYKKYLKGIHYSSETIRTYYNRLDRLLDGQSLTNTVEMLEIEKILNNLSVIKYKNHFSQSKNAFLHFLAFQNISLREEDLVRLEQFERDTRKKYRSFKPSDFEDIHQKIKYIRNKKLKLSYQIMLETGLRVFEVAQITPNDAEIYDDKIIFFFLGKGGRKETITLLQKVNPKLYGALKGRIREIEPTKKLFYSTNYLQQKAHELGLSCHDLRRAFAKLEYKRTKSKEEVRIKMRHAKIKTTNIYLRSKVKI